MGCDIHCYAEVKKNGKWEKVGDIFRNSSYDWYKENYKEIPYYVHEFTDSPCGDRNYSLFAMLAGVRNDYNIIPISKKKGLPVDISFETGREYSIWKNDAHSSSWLTVKELKEYDWKNQIADYCGWLNVREYEKFKNGEKYFSYGRDVGGSSVIKISKEDADLRLSKNDFDENKSYYVFCEWTESYYYSAEFFVDDIIPTLESLGSPEDVRIVFWFDN